MTQRGPDILFTAFEPSGDALAAPVIRAILAREPALRVVAWGGPKMRAAGAEIIEETVHDAQMGMPGVAKIVEHIRLNRRIGAWLAEHSPAVHVPVDSPAANFPICKISKAHGVRVVHLAAPQVWAWARHRVRKLRRRTDMVLCLLPFEEPWFRSRHVPARFIGHPMFDAPVDAVALDRAAAAFPAPAQHAPRLALLPGSRHKELRNNFPVMLAAWARVRSRWPGAVAVVAPASAVDERTLRDLAEARGGWPEGMVCAVAAVDAAARWADAVFTVSGTVTLQVSRQHAPMVILYRIGRAAHHAVGRWIVRSHAATLPNLIAGRRIVPEFVPCTGAADPAIRALLDLLADPAAREAQRAALRDDVSSKFAGVRAADRAAQEIIAAARTGTAGR